MLSTCVSRIDEKGVFIKSAGAEQYIEADNVIIATGYRSNNTLYQSVAELHGCVYNIGDSAKARNVYFAINEAYEVACSI
jgi:2-enoate reductase